MHPWGEKLVPYNMQTDSGTFLRGIFTYRVRVALSVVSHFYDLLDFLS